ncbi:phage baseplate protein [Haematospirillum sp. H1815]|uniref:GPW/gp25 family protein n=1 Tax=Haematospirillum sp. H1815 TaxID=2723108 RepID=UPI00143B3379|nr:GPW/gp25 family protein [Haematospirillum sp. H1815]NKD76609.1 phage baseplate protein [Haematospirillum sp. H1815]
MNGTNAKTGKPLSGLDHLSQSIRDILTTPVGSRVMRRDYGSRLPSLVDAPVNRSTILELYAATAEALARWEPRFKLQHVRILEAHVGGILMDLTGIYLPEGRQVSLPGVRVQ